MTVDELINELTKQGCFGVVRGVEIGWRRVKSGSLRGSLGLYARAPDGVTAVFVVTPQTIKQSKSGINLFQAIMEDMRRSMEAKREEMQLVGHRSDV